MKGNLMPYTGQIISSADTLLDDLEIALADLTDSAFKSKAHELAQYLYDNLEYDASKQTLAMLVDIKPTSKRK